MISQEIQRSQEQEADKEASLPEQSLKQSRTSTGLHQPRRGANLIAGPVRTASQQTRERKLRLNQNTSKHRIARLVEPGSLNNMPV